MEKKKLKLKKDIKVMIVYIIILPIIYLLLDIKNIYNLIAFMSNSNNSMTNESVSVAPKVDYMSLAKDGLDQTCIALKNCDGYESLIGVLKDINSELRTNWS